MSLRLAWDSPGSAKKKRGARPSGRSKTALGSLAALDGRLITLRNQSWVIELYGVWDSPPHRWVQLKLNGRRSEVMTLRLNAGAGLHHAILAVRSILASPVKALSAFDVA
jgi:hypothetical protein